MRLTLPRSTVSREQAFLDALNADRDKGAAFDLVVTASITLSGVYQKANFDKANRAHFNDQQEYTTILSCKKAARAKCADALSSIRQFASVTLMTGLDNGSDQINESYDLEFFRELCSDPIIDGFLIPSNVIEGVSSIAKVVWEELSKHQLWGAGIVFLRSISDKPTAGYTQSGFNLTPLQVAKFDCLMLSAFNYIFCLSRELLPEPQNSDGNREQKRYSAGPTAWAKNCIIFSMLKSLIQKFPSDCQEGIVKRYTNFLKELRISEYKMGGTPLTAKEVDAWRSSLARELELAGEMAEEFRNFQASNQMIFNIPAPAIPDTVEEAYQQSPPPNLIYLCFPFDSESGYGATVLLAGRFTTFDLHTSESNDENTFAIWSLHANGSLRHSWKGNYLPILPSDLGSNEDKFDDWATRTKAISHHLLREFNRILDFLPGLYQKIVSYDERLQIVFGAGAQVSIIAPLERSETINAALVAPLRERGGYDINTFSEDAGQRYIIEIIPKTTADNEPIERLQDLDESEFQSPQLTDHFVSRYCASYTQFVSNLIKYGATIRQCAGSHKLVSYNDRSFLYPHSLQQNRFPLRKHEVIRLLTLLGITKEEFIEFFSR